MFRVHCYSTLSIVSSRSIWRQSMKKKCQRTAYLYILSCLSTTTRRGVGLWTHLGESRRLVSAISNWSWTTNRIPWSCKWENSPRGSTSWIIDARCASFRRWPLGWPPMIGNQVYETYLLIIILKYGGESTVSVGREIWEGGSWGNTANCVSTTKLIAVGSMPS